MLNQNDEKIVDWFNDRESEMLQLTERLVNVDSGSYDKNGVDEVGRIIVDFLASYQIECKWIPVESHGDNIKATVDGNASERPILLMGHRDTVFPKGEATRRPFSISDKCAFGPGVADMKSGLVQNAFILAAFKELSLAPGPITGLFTGDEEIGTPASRKIIEAEAKKARLAFNSEPGRVSGNVVTGRRGGIFFRCEVFGRAAHAGNSFELGRSAIAEVADKIQRWFGMNDTFADKNITVNVGLVSGGQSVNTVAPYSTCEIDMRYVEPHDRETLVAAVKEIAANCTVAETHGEITIMGEFLPVAASTQSNALFNHYRQAATDLGIELDGEFTRSCADSGFTAALGVPTLCGVGPIGGRAHGPDEYLDIASIVPRAQALALSIARTAPET